MRMPVAPPSRDELMDSLLSVPNAFEKLQTILQVSHPTPNGKYLHWDKLRFLTPPDGLTVEEWWLGTKISRNNLSKDLPLRATSGSNFKYMRTDLMDVLLHEIDKNASGVIGGHSAQQVTTPGVRDSYIFKSLIEEAITSSQLEGAITTHKVAKDMLQRGRDPRDYGERMIYNNHKAMLHIREIKKKPLTPEVLFDLHHILTQGTLNDPTAAGRFRREDENVYVTDAFENVLHVPPPASELSQRMRAMCDFANEDANSVPFIHPVIRAILLHFWLAYDHPFIDGNGRAARALFYWSMAHQGYWLCEFLSISKIIKGAPSAYGRSFLYTETDNNDATYFIIAQLKVINRAIQELHKYLERKATELHETQNFLKQSHFIKTTLNYRQIPLISHALKNPYFVYTVESHRRSHNISNQTARKDLLILVEHNLLDQVKVGHAFNFVAPPDMRIRLENLSGSKTKEKRN